MNRDEVDELNQMTKIGLIPRSYECDLLKAEVDNEGNLDISYLIADTGEPAASIKEWGESCSTATFKQMKDLMKLFDKLEKDEEYVRSWFPYVNI